MKHRRTLFAIVAGGALAALIPLAPAVAGQSPPQSPPDPVIEIGSRARLQADGAAIIVPVKVTCAKGTDGPGTLHVTVNQRIGDRIVRGEGALTTVRCDDDPTNVRVPTLPAERPFRTGKAFAVAQFGVCYPVGCVNGEDFGEIRIVR